MDIHLVREYVENISNTPQTKLPCLTEAAAAATTTGRHDKMYIVRRRPWHHFAVT